MEIEYENERNKLIMSLEIYKYDNETNCISIDRISGDTADFVEQYSKIQ